MPWEELSPVTVDAKGFAKVLVKTGRLYESVVTPNGTSDTIWETSADPAYLIFGTSVPYAKYHQTGTRRMPARPFMGMNRKTEDQVVNAVADAAVKRITKEK
jgi:phage gpG-like protein